MRSNALPLPLVLLPLNFLFLGVSFSNYPRCSMKPRSYFSWISILNVVYCP
jgi:hypothetical protein